MKPKYFEDPLLKILYREGESASHSIEREVCSLLNLPFHKEHKSKIQAAFRTLQRKGLVQRPSRGVWTLTPQGSHLMATPPKETKTEKAPDVSLDTQSHAFQISFLTPPPPSNLDPYIEMLQGNQTPCFGHYTPQPQAHCRTCPLQSSCWSHTLTRLLEDKATHLPPKKKAKTKDLQDAPKKTKVEFKVPEGQHIRITTEGGALCCGCGHPIAKGDKAIWLRDKSSDKVHHIKCPSKTQPFLDETDTPIPF